MKKHHKKIQTLAALVGLICFLTGVTSLAGLRSKFLEVIDDAKMGMEAGGGGVPAEEPQPAGTPATGRGVPPGCRQLDESGQQVGLWRDECEQCREGTTFDLSCIRNKGIDPFKAPAASGPGSPGR